MAKRDEVNTEENTAGVEGDAPKQDNRSIVLNVPEGHVSGLSGEVKRSDYIKNRWASRSVSRGEIAKELTELQGKEVPYQIVFQATKGLEGGKPKAEKVEEAAAE